MTGILSNQLPGRANPPDADNPLGSFKDRTAPGANDGSYLKEEWANDRDSLLQALFISSGLTPNGINDTGTASQLFDALVNKRWSSIGNYSVGTVVTAANGKQYYCNQANGRDTSIVDPITDTLDFWREYPYEKVVNSNGIAYKYWDGRLVCTYSDDSDRPYTSPNTVTFNITFPLPFNSTPESVVASLKKGVISTGGASFSAEVYTSNGFEFKYSGSNDTSVQVSYTAEGVWI